MTKNMSYRLAVDIGGTFTDLVLLDEASGALHGHKILTTPHAPEEAALRGLRELCARARITPAQITILIHATTLVTNALIERKGAATALLTTAGFRDTLEMGKWSIIFDELQRREGGEVGADWDIGAHRVLEAEPGDGILRALQQDEIDEALGPVSIRSPLHDGDAADLPSGIGGDHVLQGLAVIFRFSAVVQPSHPGHGFSSDDQGDRARPRCAVDADAGVETLEPLEPFVLAARPEDLRGEKDVPSSHRRGIPRRNLPGVGRMQQIIPGLRVRTAAGLDLLFVESAVDDDDQGAGVESVPEPAGVDVFGWDLTTRFLRCVIRDEQTIPGQRLVDFNRPAQEDIRARSGGLRPHSRGHRPRRRENQ